MGKDRDAEKDMDDTEDLEYQTRSKNKKVEFDNKELGNFGYEFNAKGQLRHVETGKPFEFVDQTHYDALGAALVESIYQLMEEKGLFRVQIPLENDDDTAESMPSIEMLSSSSKSSDFDPKTCIFLSKNALECDRLLILIHGSGAVRAGMWARRLIINDSLQSGTMLPFIERAQSEGYGIAVLNGNSNYAEDPTTKRHKFIRGSESPEDHALYVWDKFIAKAKAQHIAIVAHSYGGVVTVNLLQSRREALQRIAAVAFTDSVHSVHRTQTLEVKEFMKKNVINWVASSKARDDDMGFRGGCQCLSSGAALHEETSWAAFESIFPFLNEKILNHN